MEPREKQTTRSANCQYRMRVIPRELSESACLLADGRHYQSLSALDRYFRSVRNGELDPWFGWGLVIAAKDRFHLEDDPGAIECMLAVPRSLLDQSTDFRAQYFVVEGLIRKRRAYSMWKNGEVDTAIQEVSWAIDCFRTAESAAFGDNQHLIRLNAQLNAVYAEGLLAAIHGQSTQKNESLLQSAIVIEAHIRRWSPPKLRNDLEGLVIICDLSRPIGLTIDDIRQLNWTNEGRVACAELFGAVQTNWPALLLDTAAAHVHKPFVNAQGLVLGATMLIQSQYRQVLSDLTHRYQVRLVDALLSLQKEVQRENTLTRRTRDVIRRIRGVLPDGDIRTNGFCDRRMFR